MIAQALEAGNSQAPPIDPYQAQFAQLIKNAREVFLSQIQPRSDNTLAEGKIKGAAIPALAFTHQLIEEIADDGPSSRHRKHDWKKAMSSSCSALRKQ